LGRSVVIFGALVLVLLVAGPASAEPPLEVTDRITDRVGALGSETASVEASVEELSAEDDLDLHAVFVSSFDSADASDWAEDTAQLSELSGSDILLAVAVGDETYEYGWWVDESFALSEVDVDNVISDQVAPELGAGNWPGAVVALSEQLRSLAATDAEEASQTPQWSAVKTLLVVGVIAAVLLAAHLLSRRRSAANPVR
jgi:uncharacterized membrane protein YgcG